MDKNLLSVNQVAEILNLSRVQIVRLINSGKIPAQKVGRNYVINLIDLDNELIDKPVIRIVKEYGETLKRLGDE